tara:strand:- start:506 stop:715 length:210 start_codon:yes stop_codon:yes gene_type:complete
MWKWMIPMLVLTACEAARTPEGCKIYATEMMQAETRACVAAYHAEMAKAAGKPVTRCFDNGAGVTCVQE